MSRVIAGQVRILDRSSSVDSMFLHKGIGRGVLKSVVPKPVLNNHPNLVKDVSQRGKGDGKKGDVDKSGTDLLKGSSFTEPFAHFSVGFDLVLEDNKDLDGDRKSKRKGTRKIILPNRQGKDNDAGISVPNRKEPLPPTKKSDLVKKNVKKQVRRIKKVSKGVRPRSKQELSNSAHNSIHLKE